MGADALEKHSSACFPLSDQQKSSLAQLAQSLHDPKLRKLAAQGIAFHHAGVGHGDRCLIEESFRQGHLMILLCTNTLAMGVNLPARLVVIKSTETYYCGSLTEYPESTLLQMIGRAGRPKYDTKGVAVILTHIKNVSSERMKVLGQLCLTEIVSTSNAIWCSEIIEWFFFSLLITKHKYESLMNGKMPVESHLHKHLAEHLNSEIALGTIKNLEVAMTWMRSTYLYVRSIKNPLFYGLHTNMDKDLIEKKLEQMCLTHINALQQAGLLTKSPTNELDVQTTSYGKLMAKYYINFETMKLFRQLRGSETFSEVLELIVRCKEFNEFTLRVNEKRCLNELNESPLRFPIAGRIKTRENKISCLIQALLGNIQIPVSGLAQESVKMLRIADRIAKCMGLLEYMRLSINQADEFRLGCYKALLHTVTIAKCFHARLWENSEYTVKQLQKIDVVYTDLLAKAGKSTLKSLAATDARTIESILNKPYPFGDKVLENLNTFPEYSLELKKQSANMLHICAQQINEEYLYGGTSSVIIVGDSANNLLLHIENLDAILQEYGVFMRSIKVPDTTAAEVYAHIIHSTLVGVDKQVHIALTPKITNDLRDSSATKKRNKRKQTASKICNTKRQKQHSESCGRPIHLESNKAHVDLNKFAYTKCKLQDTTQNLVTNLNKSFCESKYAESSAANITSDVNDKQITAQNKLVLVQTKLTKYFTGKCDSSVNASTSLVRDGKTSKQDVDDGFRVTTPILHDLTICTASPKRQSVQHNNNTPNVLETLFMLSSESSSLSGVGVEQDNISLLYAAGNELEMGAPLDLSKKPHLCENQHTYKSNSCEIRSPFPDDQLYCRTAPAKTTKHAPINNVKEFNGCLTKDTSKNALDLSRAFANRNRAASHTGMQSCSEMSVSYSSSIPITPTSTIDESLLHWYRVTQAFLQLNEEQRNFAHFKTLYQRLQQSNSTINHITTQLHRSTISESETIDVPDHNTRMPLTKLNNKSHNLEWLEKTAAQNTIAQKPNRNQNNALLNSPKLITNSNPFRLQIFKNNADTRSSSSNNNHAAIKSINKDVMDLVLSMKCENNGNNINEKMEFDYSHTIDYQLQTKQTQVEPKLTFEEYCRLFFDST